MWHCERTSVASQATLDLDGDVAEMTTSER